MRYTVRSVSEAPELSGRRAVLWTLAAALTPLAGCGLIGSRHRFRLTVEVEVEGRRYTGSGVREVVSREVSAFPQSGTNVLSDVRGEAFWIDIPGKPTIFVTLKEVEGGWSRYWMPGSSVDAPGEAAFRPSPIPPSRGPALVYFEDINDLSSIRAVRSEVLPDRFGRGARVVGISVAKTRDPLSIGILEKLPWMALELSDYRRRPSIYSRPSKYIFSVTQFYLK